MRSLSSASVVHDLFPDGKIQQEQMCLSCRKELRTCSSFVPVFVFTRPTSQESSSDVCPNYYDGSSHSQLGRLFYSYCSHCKSRNEYGRFYSNGIVTLLAAGIYNRQFPFVKITPHKLIHFDLLRELYFSIAITGTSFEKAAKSFSITKCTALAEKVDFKRSTFFNREIAKEMLPCEFKSVGMYGVVPFLEPDDVESAFFLCAAIMRTLRAPRLVFTYREEPRSKRTVANGVVAALLKDFEDRGISQSSTHACLDCSYYVGDKIVTTCVIDGVTATACVCAAKDCCGELKNHRSDRFCAKHYSQHWLCGVYKMPGKSGPCTNFVRNFSSDQAITLTTTRPESVTCDDHYFLEQAWRSNEVEKAPYLAQVREAGVRGAHAKSRSTRLANPADSDHCVAIVGDTEEKRSQGFAMVECKSTWIAASAAVPSIEHVGRFTVSFRRQFAHVYCVICRPCGIIVNGKFFSDAESPTEVTQFVQETFPTRTLMPNIIYFDAACQVSKSIYSKRGKLAPLQNLFNTSLWVVPPIHQKSHKPSDKFCQDNCKAINFKECLTPTGAHRFNGTACEELFAHLGKRVAIVRTMRKSYAQVYYKIVHEEHNLMLIANRIGTAFSAFDSTGNRKKPQKSKPGNLRSTRF